MNTQDRPGRLPTMPAAPARGRLSLPRPGGLLHESLRKLIGHGTLTVAYSDGRLEEYGDGTAPFAGIALTPEAERGLLLNPGLKLGECYMDGSLQLVEGDLYDLLHVLIDNRTRRRMPAALRAASALQRWLPERMNDAWRAKANVAHHYDLDGRLYDLFLDRNRQYSCAYFERPGMTLDEAQEAKMRRISRKLWPQQGLRVLDIGSGWGGLALHLARECGMRVQGITLSEEQLAASRRWAADEGLDHLVRFDPRDYRQLEGRFDRIVSVGMLEHVGRRSLGAYFAKVGDLLAEDGVALIHSIGSYFEPKPTNPWMTKYIFPGGYLPSLSEVMTAVQDARLIVADIEIWRLHYAETLRHWRQRFLANRDKAAELYDERFCRMWDFYLAGSEASFRVGISMVFQVLLVKDRSLLPQTRSYMEATG